MHCYDITSTIATDITILFHVQINSYGGVGAMQIFSPIMLALCLMLFSTYYAQNYAGMIGAGLAVTLTKPAVKFFSFKLDTS